MNGVSRGRASRWKSHATASAAPAPFAAPVEPAKFSKKISSVKAATPSDRSRKLATKKAAAPTAAIVSAGE
jgi:hypothetical protein